jgi:Skp family chaperone for outer membrane proteins
MSSKGMANFIRGFFHFFFLAVFCPLYAEPSPSIAVVDVTKVFSVHPGTAAATADLTRAREVSRESFKEKSNRLKEILQRHQELIRAGKREDAAEELKAANTVEKEIATLQTTELRDLEEQFRKAKEEIIQSILASIRKFNEDSRYGLILDLSSSSSNGLPQVIDAPGAKDITDEVIAFVKKEAEAAE